MIAPLAVVAAPVATGRMVLHLRGISGSGKSWLVYQLLQDPALRWQEDRGLPLDPHLPQQRLVLRGYTAPDHGLAIVGPYRTACGGCDAVPTQDEIGLRIKAYAALRYHVVFEGLLASGLASRYEQLAAELAMCGVTYYGVWLDTPLAQCLARVQARRAARGDDRPFNSHNTIAKHARVTKCLQRMQALGYHTELLPMANGAGVPRLRALLGLQQGPGEEGVL